ncbi:MAG: hypothetical protein ACK5Q5_10855 [Planctomycetaceae bacterium]
MSITIRDETTAGNIYASTPLELPSEQMSVRELIRERICQEVQDDHRGEGERGFRGPVQPTNAERVLNRPHAVNVDPFCLVGLLTSESSHSLPRAV